MSSLEMLASACAFLKSSSTSLSSGFTRSSAVSPFLSRMLCPNHKLQSRWWGDEADERKICTSVQQVPDKVRSHFRILHSHSEMQWCGLPEPVDGVYVALFVRKDGF